jgi:prepilin-type processing-associated H-X9-DG protein
MLVALTLILVAILLPAVQSSSSPGHFGRCANNLKRLGLALHLYHEDHGSFPPAYIADDDGKPMHSWRVLLLPYLEEKIAYGKYRWDEPWNGPNNSRLGINPYDFQCSADQATFGSSMTSYVLVTGPGTPFPDGASTKIDDFRDGVANTILIVEVANSGIHWMEPRDLNIQQMATTLNAKPGQGISSCHSSGAVVVFADGHTEFLDAATSAEQLRAMLTIDGGEVVKARD